MYFDSLMDTGPFERSSITAQINILSDRLVKLVCVCII